MKKLFPLLLLWVVVLSSVPQEFRAGTAQQDDDVHLMLRKKRFAGGAVVTTVNCGETSQSASPDAGNNGVTWGTPCVTGSDVNGYVVSSIAFWASSESGTLSNVVVDVGVYSNSSNAPDSLLCSATITIPSVTTSWTLENQTISGCGTLAANTLYWVGYLEPTSGNENLQQGRVAGTCPGTSLYTFYANDGYNDSSLPNPFSSPTSQGGDCYAFYMQLIPQ